MREGSRARSTRLPTPPAPADAPSAVGSWLAKMSSAAATVKPTITGCERKLAAEPPRTRPMRMRITPTSSASSTARPTYSVPPGSASGVSAPRVSRLVMAVGPVWR